MSTAGAASGKAGTGAGRPARWLARRTLRGRLIAGLLALLAVACAAVGLVTYVALHDSLINQLDVQLAAASQRYSFCVGHPPPDGEGHDSGQQLRNTPESCAQQQASQTFSAQVRNGTVTDAYIASTV